MHKNIFFIILISLFNSIVPAKEKTEKDKLLEQNFITHPNSARPQTWWHWMDGNVTLEGIRADMEAFQSIGMGGVKFLEMGYAIPQGPVGLESTFPDIVVHFAVDLGVAPDPSTHYRLRWEAFEYGNDFPRPVTEDPSDLILYKIVSVEAQ